MNCTLTDALDALAMRYGSPWADAREIASLLADARAAGATPTQIREATQGCEG